MASEKRLIDANEVERKLKIAISSWRCDCNSNAPVIARAMEDALQRVIHAPTVDAVEVVHGAWMDFADSFEKRRGRMDLRCSVCRNRASKFVYGTEDWWDGCKPNYCPNCGALMDGGAEGDK